MISRGLLGLLLLLLTAGGADAHKASDAYLRLVVTPGTVTGSLDLALRDLDQALGLDGDGDGVLTWGELRARHEAIAAYVQSRLRFAQDGPCALVPLEHLVDRHADGAYAVLRFQVDCLPGAGRLMLRYDLFFDLDPLHRGLVQVAAAGRTRTAILSPDESELAIDPAGASGGGFGSFVLLGARHLFTGFDHLLFLLVVLLPAVHQRGGGRWRPVESWRRAAGATVGILTAFTLAHGLSLAAALTGLIALPSRLVESAIAATIVLTAIDNIRPCLPAARWQIAFAFGLIHGLGFATVLGALALPPAGFITALLGFNLGIEAGQLAITLLFLPVAFTLRGFGFYDRAVLSAGSAAALALSTFWLLDRSLALGIAPF